MAQLKDLIVNGAAKFNGSVEGNLHGNADGAYTLVHSLQGDISSTDVSDKYYLIGSYTTTEDSYDAFTSKLAFYDNISADYNRAEMIISFQHDASDNSWKRVLFKIRGSINASRFYLIEVSGIEMQIWVKISGDIFENPTAYCIYGDSPKFTNTPNSICDVLPDGNFTIGSYDIQQHTAYGTCDTDSNIAEKIVIVSNAYWDMSVGSILTVKFDNTNTAENPTFNVNGIGAVPVVYDSSNITSENLSYAGYAGRYIAYVYTGYTFVFIGWSVDDNTTYENATSTKDGLMSAKDKLKLDNISNSADAVEYTKVLTGGTLIGTITINGNKIEIYAPVNTDTTYDIMTGATEESDGTSGLVPAPEAGNVDAYLKADGSWGIPAGTTYENATSTKDGLMSATDKDKLDGINIMTGATSGEEGAAGLVPTPAASDVHKFLKADGTWADPASIIKKSVIPAEATTEVDIPTEISSSNNMIVYYNGLLMEENVNYYISESKLISIDFSFSKDSVITFVGSNADSSVNVNTPADQVTLANGESKFDGNNSVQSGMEWLASQILALQINNTTQNAITLNSADWVNNSQTVEVSGVTESNGIILSPILQDQETYTDCNVSCISQSDGKLTFECDKTPEIDLRIIVIIL